MTYFTDNPLERLMRQTPMPGRRKARQDEKPEESATGEQALDSSPPTDAAPLLIDRLRQLIPCALDKMA